MARTDTHCIVNGRKPVSTDVKGDGLGGGAASAYPVQQSRTGLRYRTCDDIRAIENDQWEAWIVTNTVPWAAFPAERNCQRLTRYLLKLAVERIMRRGR